MNSWSYTACALKSGAMLPTSGGLGVPPTMPSPACRWRSVRRQVDAYDAAGLQIRSCMHCTLHGTAFCILQKCRSFETTCVVNLDMRAACR